MTKRSRLRSFARRTSTRELVTVPLMRWLEVIHASVFVRIRSDSVAHVTSVQEAPDRTRGFYDKFTGSNLKDKRHRRNA